MIQSGLTENRIDGLEKLFNVFPRDVSFRGAYLKGVLLHDNGDVQLTYSIKSAKTYIIVFVMSDCEDLTNFRVTAQKIKIEGIDIDVVQNDMLHFVDQSNEIDIVCQGLKITTNVLLSEDFAKEQATKLTQEYADIIQKKVLDLEKLEPLPNGEPLFRRDDSYHGIHANHHTMYKLRDLTNKDNSIVYEFLIEFDRNNPSLGIYYGCKALIKKGDNLTRIAEKYHVTISELMEWNNLNDDKILEVNNEFREQLEKAGLCFSGTSPDNSLVEIIEIKEHPWFVGVQFHPEFKSSPRNPHPLFKSFIEAALRYRDEYEQE